MQFESSLKPKLIYVFRINDAAHKGCLKVGEATCNTDNVFGLVPGCKVLNQAARERINQYTQTAGIVYELLYTELTLFVKDKRICSFNDKEVHRVLERSGISRKTFMVDGNPNEWFATDLETVKRAIAAVKAGKASLTAAEISTDRSPIVFRPEQRAAIDKTKKQFGRGSAQMLWNAKMRFGKTLSALQVVKELQFGRTLILTHRPVVDAGWFEDFGKIFYDSPNYAYGSKNNGEPYQLLEKRAAKDGLNYVYFASMQDLRGSEQVGGHFDKNNDVFSTPWDFIIVDEAHEGTQTELGRAVMAELTKPTTKVLRLSGTPFNLLDDYKEDDIYTWDYVMEQRAKADWDKTHFGDPNPYAGLPRMNIYTYDLGRLLHDYVDDVAFNFTEFFRVGHDGRFKHEQDVRAFVNLLTKDDPDSCYPYANDTYRDIFRHTLWMVPGVAAAKALKTMLDHHPVFQHFQVVNVAGDGTAEEESRDAREAVLSAIGPDPDQTRTITLSCGRLTTGVSIKPWTAVFILSGGYATGAATYMQTIFRVQTPATINGRVKEQCYVFDFAPDRTLRVLAETAKVSVKAGQTTDGDRRAMGEFLNFCPVIGIEGSRMTPYDENEMLRQLKRAYIERVVKNGFEDNRLYSDELLKLDDVALNDFAELKKTIGATKASPKTKDIDINTQGLTNEEYEETETLNKKKRKKELTEDEKKRLETLNAKKKNRENAISILRGISIRMPLMIYGAEVKDEETPITIDNFASLIDPQSWEEFMPRGVTKADFNKFKRYYDPDIFAAAAKRIRSMARAADRLSVEERIERITAIFSTFRNPDKETVLTPWRVVNMHLADTLGGYCFFDEHYEQPLAEPRLVDHGEVTAQVFSPESHVLEINSKSGLYPLYVAYSVYRARVKNAMFSPESIEEEQALWDEAVAHNVFVICKTPMAKSITRRTLVGFRPARVNTHYFEDLINQIKNKPDNFIAKVCRGHSYWKANNDDNMKFDAVVGNPPYQVVNKGNGNGADPIYHDFIDRARDVSVCGTLIHPARFLFNAGKTPKEWNQKILNDPHIKVVDYWANSMAVFPTVDVKGGIAVTYWHKKEEFGKIGFFSAFDELRSILHKVKSLNEEALSTIVAQRELYSLTETLYAEHPELEGRQSKGHKYSLGANIFDVFPELFKDDEEGAQYEGMAKIYGRCNNQRCYKWIDERYITHPENYTCYKVIIPEANASGAIGEVLSTPIVGTPIVGYTDTFLGIGCYNKKQEAKACLKYIKTKFARTMLGTLKATQHNPRDTWANVPLQDFTVNSDIDWSQSVPEIDRQLYAKYHLSEEEIAFIERMIKPM